MKRSSEEVNSDSQQTFKRCPITRDQLENLIKISELYNLQLEDWLGNISSNKPYFPNVDTEFQREGKDTSGNTSSCFFWNTSSLLHLYAFYLHLTPKQHRREAELLHPFHRRN